MAFPEEFLKRIEQQQGIDRGLLLEALSQPSPVSIRLNPSKWSAVPTGGAAVPWCSDGYFLPGRPSYTLDPLFHAGCYYPQEASSMFTGEAFRQLTEGQDDLRVLDLCGAPGGKSTHISTLLGTRGVLFANEVIRTRASVLAENLTRWGTANTVVCSVDPIGFSRLEGFFDLIVADVPCSGEGMFRDETAVQEWTVANTLLCSDRQRRIIMDAWPSLKEGGVLLYSTCTFNPAENEENIKWILSECKGESIKLATEMFPGISEINYRGITGYAFYPDKIRGEGFFISAIRKTSPAASVRRTSSRFDSAQLTRQEREIISSVLRSEPPLIMKDENNLFAVPLRADEYGLISGKLNMVKRGTFLGNVVHDKLIPSHELALSVLLNTTTFPSAELDYETAIAYLRKDNINPSGIPPGWVLARYSGMGLGFLKNIGSRINNYLPVSLRIRMEPGQTGKSILQWEGQ
jgi:16S rRNA C967 or C1407 C5-methylase (RsmB/RsmF family)/NOL1/NOP2/fmu family ribosome biogenesis protein